MSDLNYNVNVNVTGADKVEDLREDVDALVENPTLTIDATGVTETAEGLESISNTDADTKIGDVGVAAGTASTPMGTLGTNFKTLVAAIGVAQIAGYGLDFVLGLVRSRLDFIAETNAWDQQQVDEYKAAVDEVGVGLEAIEGKLREAGEFTDVNQTGLFGLGGGEWIDAASTLGAFGFTVDDVARAIRGGDEALDAFENTFREASGSGDLTRLVMGAVRDEADAYAKATNGAAERALFFSESQQSANDALQQMLDREEPLRRYTDEWELLMESMADGTIDTTAAAGALNTLSDGLSLTTDEVLVLAQAEIDKEFERAAAGAQAFADAVENIDFQNADIDGATNAMSDYTDELFRVGNEAQAEEAAFDALRATVADVAFTMDLGTEAGRAQQDALEGVARVIDDDLARAYENANGNQAVFTEQATRLAEDVLTRLDAELNLTDEQVAALAVTMGLTPEQIQTRFELAGEQEALIQLGLLQGAIDGLPDAVSTEVTLAILAGDYVGARDTIVEYYESNPAPLPITYEFPDVGEAIAASFAGHGPEGVAIDLKPTVGLTDQEDLIEMTVTLDDTAARAAFAAFHGDMTDYGNIVSHVVLDSEQAGIDMTTFVVDSANLGILTSVAVDTVDATTALDSFVNEIREAEVDVVVGSVPSTSTLVSLATGGRGYIEVPIRGRWATRIEGSRPGPG